ncbi:MAG: single-stranded-DNA-specific exonuclease RecJ [Candidatus Shapirobacteria bacterium]
MNQLQIILKSKKIIERGIIEADFLELLLTNRGITKSKTAEFLKPNNPKKLEAKDFGVNQKQLDLAVNRIKQAIDNQENVLIYGDYDVDGITSTAVLWKSLRKNGLKVMPFIPDREHDGYGIKAKSFFKFEEERATKFSLLITVDNGIVANKEIQKIIDTGVDVIITDHHLPTESLPNCLACVHSTAFSGCTLAWLLALQFDSEADLGLAALGAIADCMPLVGINRSIVVHGIQELRLNPSPGMKKLMQVSGSKQESLSAYDLGYILGPRINAVGRLSNPTDALRLLCSPTLVQAAKYAQVLDDHNKDRQILQKDSLEVAEKNIFNNSDKLVFIADKSYIPGIIGLLAGKMTEKYYLPSIAISIGDEVSKGSCRSIKELNIIDSLRQASDLLIELGGHAGAAGFSIKTENIAKFKKEITKIINEKLSGLDLKPSIIVDAQMELSAVTLKNCQIIKKLEPFGIDNFEPLFLFQKVTVSEKRVVGSTGDHLKLKFNDTNAIAFKKGDLDKQIKVGDKVDIIARLDINVWNNTSTPQLMVKEILL